MLVAVLFARLAFFSLVAALYFILLIEVLLLSIVYSSIPCRLILLLHNYLEWREENVTENKTKLRNHSRNQTDNHDG